MYKISRGISNKKLFKVMRIQKGAQTNQMDALGRRMAKDCPLGWSL